MLLNASEQDNETRPPTFTCPAYRKNLFVWAADISILSNIQQSPVRNLFLDK